MGGPSWPPLLYLSDGQWSDTLVHMYYCANALANTIANAQTGYALAQEARSDIY